ncbi:MAG: N-acetyl-gamma-glutamyl-phosphate reductase [Pseudomonadota bacterium]
MVRVAVVGGTGYTGAELIRLALAHPEVDLKAVTSRSDEGVALGEYFPSLSGHSDLRFVAPHDPEVEQCDVVFFATPHGVAMNDVPRFLSAGCKVIDLSADYRIKDVALWERWYGVRHASPEFIEGAVYGLPEYNREKLRDASLVACPGCYPTAVQLGFLPLLISGVVDPGSLIASAVSGVSGAGRKAKMANLFAEVDENFFAYGVGGHRHLPEIEEGLSSVSGATARVTFVPHLAPMSRGIHATLFARLDGVGAVSCNKTIHAQYRSAYDDEPFIDVLDMDVSPETRSVRGLNRCQMSVTIPDGGHTVVVTVVEDNLVKGAAGQAIQCMNLMLGKAETCGLGGIALFP